MHWAGYISSPIVVTLEVHQLLIYFCTAQVIDERLAKGLWNAGLLSTQAGTIGRLCGNLLLSLCARITGATAEPQIQQLASVLFGSAFVFMVFSLAYVLALYSRLTA